VRLFKLVVWWDASVTSAPKKWMSSAEEKVKQDKKHWERE